ncbi:hypothetical protein D9611_006218 [Ephemerocybe angulata]|uniref:Uncharacterized protein n=1 Tax=Ephemerocybe angulata TaxID=980116 RepID=A0A8H5FGV9_9AGAR|nr:hypothetical protein D9611_006218 [Tulosesus angulatus]
MSTFNDRAENTHRIEFEAPNSAEVQPVPPRKHFSIDLSLELEQQLNMESPPVTPAHFPVTATEDLQQLHEALDPEVLAHLVSQLRHSLAEMTKERDGLAKLLAASHTKQASLNDALQHMTEKVTDLGEELNESRKKMRDDEEAISLLRAKVEESRRGLMRLQTEHKRQSMTPIDVNRATMMLSNPPTSKRASFTPLTGRSTNGHRRVSSVSDGFALLGLTSPDLNTSPNTQVLTLPDTAGSNPPPSSARYPTLFGGRSSPPQSDAMMDVPLSTSETLELKESIQRLKAQLEAVQHELSEANEARQASETCVEALRTFIAENNFSNGESSASSIKLPPPPTMTTGEEEPDTSKKRGGASQGGWGFKLWGGDAQAASTVPHSAPLSGPPAPFQRKLGGLFSSSRSASISSMHSATLPPLQTNASNMQRLPSHGSSSDTSSVTEPLSPGDDIHGLGTRVQVRDGSYVSDGMEGHGILEIKNLDLELVR